MNKYVVVHNKPRSLCYVAELELSRVILELLCSFYNLFIYKLSSVLSRVGLRKKCEGLQDLSKKIMTCSVKSQANQLSLLRYIVGLSKTLHTIDVMCLLQCYVTFKTEFIFLFCVIYL